MVDFALEDLVFIIAALGGGGLLAVSLVYGVTDRERAAPQGPASSTRPALAFLALFGVGGLVASRTLDVQGGQALIAATGAGVVGMGLAILALGPRSRAKD